MATKIKRDINKVIELNVLKKNAELGNVPNVSTNEQTPTWSNANQLNNISSGETLSNIMSKIAKAIDSIINHISNQNNPHNITKDIIGLSNVDNTSDVEKKVLYANEAGKAKASDVYNWAKQVNKPVYSYDELIDKPIIPSGIEVIDNLLSTSTISSLSANQGRVLNNKINNKIILSKFQPSNQEINDVWYEEL